LYSGPFVAVPQHDRFHVVVQASRRHAAEVLEGADVLTQRGRQVLALNKAQILTTRVAQQIAEQVDATAAFTGKVDIVSAVIHLGLDARRRLETLQPVRAAVAARSSSTRSRTMLRPPRKPWARSSSRIAHDGDVGIACQQLANRVVERIDLARPARLCTGKYISPSQFPRLC